MSSWHSLELGDGVDAFAPSGKIQDAFMVMCGVTRQPVDFAVFSRYDLRRNVVTVYFSPCAELLAKAFMATACERPTNDGGFGLLAGDQRAWNSLFPADGIE